MTNETEIEATFEASCVSAGAKKQAYEVIAGSGENASTLHYVANNQPLKGRQLVCLDAGCEWECYASDVTRTFPISGTFSKEATEIYDIVKEMQERCVELVKPGVNFRNLHLLALQIAVKGLMKLGILHNGSFEAVLRTGIAFFPHGVCVSSIAITVAI
jgi:Xaa-Pro dipeptidase